MNIVPLQDRVVIEPIEEQNQTEGGLFLPEASKEKPQTGKVLAVGPGLYQAATLIPMRVRIGATVLYARYAGIEVKMGNKKVIVCRESDILAVLSE